MPAIKLLKTTLGGYEVFNLDSTLLATFFKAGVDISPQCDGVATVFSLPGGDQYVSGTLLVFLNGICQNATGWITLFSPGAGTFTVSAPPLLGDTLLICYLKSN